MLTIKQLRDDREAAIRRLAKKGVDAAPVIAEIEKLDDRRKAIQHELDECLATQNQAAKQIGALMGQGRRDEAEAKKAEVASLKERSNALNAEFKEVSDALQAAIVTLPNFPADIVPEGKTAEDNLVVKLVESYTQLPENPLPHWELARKYDIIDFDLGVKLTGAGFPVIRDRAPGCSVRSSTSSSTATRGPGIWKWSLRSWSMKPPASALDNCPTRRDRCTMPRRTTSTSFRRPKCP